MMKTKDGTEISQQEPDYLRSTALYVAVMDGSDPHSWAPFGTNFSDVMRNAMPRGKPAFVPKDLARDWLIHLQADLSGPTVLLDNRNAQSYVGVIVDARTTGSDEYKKALLENFRSLCRRIKVSSTPLWKSLGYFTIWLVTDDADNPLTGDLLYDLHVTGKAELNADQVRHAWILDESHIPVLMRNFLSNAFFSIAVGGQ